MLPRLQNTMASLVDWSEGGMSPREEYVFLTNFSSAMRHSESVRALEALWKDYEKQIAVCSQEGREELRKLRAERERELMGAARANQP